MYSVVKAYASSMNNNHIHNHLSAPATFTETYVNEYNQDNYYTAQLYPENDPTPNVDNLSPHTTQEMEISKNPDHFDAVLNYLNEMLMEEEELQNKPCILDESLALQVQAAEESLYDVLINKHSQPCQDQGQKYAPDHSTVTNNSEGSNIYHPGGTVANNLHGNKSNENYSRKRSHSPEDEHSTKQSLTSTNSDSDQSEFYDDDLLLCNNEPQLCKSSKKIKRGRPRGRRKESTKEVVDLGNLLTQCVQATTSNNPVSAHEVLRNIKKHCTPYGDFSERLAYYFANAIEARLAGKGIELYEAFKMRKISAAQTLKAYHSYIIACPFHRMSNILANGSITKLAKGKGKLHIIDFGILYGLQWPCFIKALSLRPEGPPKLRITGIELPQPEFRPGEQVEETGRRLANYCRRIGVPFKYHGIAKEWDKVRVEDLKIKSDEFTVVTCMYRLRNVPDDQTVVESSPRDAVLQLIRRVEPDLFIHGVLNGTHNAPFLLTRFREALFHFSTLFDMFESTTNREDKDRLLFEQEVFGSDIMNVIACEGTSRVERPEAYKQWQSRNVRAGFRQIALYQEKVKEVRAKVKFYYHSDFWVDEDSNWMLQGWKGRVLYALSLWKPA